jgi:PAS domain S-box-containing protein
MCIRILSRYEVVVRWFGFMVLGIGIWALSYGFELSSTTLEQMLFWINIEYLGIAFMPAFWLLFIVKFTGRDKGLNTKNFIWIIIIPLITLLMVWTNHFHKLHYKSVSVDNSGPFPLLNIETGPWYLIHTIYFYILLAWGVWLLLNKYRKSDTVFKRQNLIILLAAFIPWFANLAYLFGFRPMGHIDSTPFAFVLTVLMLSIGLVRFRLLDIIPIAREKVLEAMKEGLIVTDNLDRIIDLNREIKKILTISSENLIGKNIDFVFPNQPELFEYIFGRKDGRIKIELQRNGYPIFLEVSITALFEDENSFNGLIILTRDITGQVEIENQLRVQSEQLSAMNKLKDRLFSIISHDLRGPLINLNEVIKLLNAGMITEDEFKSFIPKLSKNIGYTTGLLENLLFWSRSQLQGEIIKPVYFDLKLIADNAVALFENVIKEKNIITDNHLDPNTLVYADMDMIQLIVRNLISNAVKFSKHGGSIKITSYKEGKSKVICFSDSGVGISEENQRKLFEQETFTTRGTDNEEGTGLGLLLCKDFIEKNGGKIWVESKIGVGSNFCLQIPDSPVHQ